MQWGQGIQSGCRGPEQTVPWRHDWVLAGLPGSVAAAIVTALAPALLLVGLAFTGSL